MKIVAFSKNKYERAKLGVVIQNTILDVECAYRIIHGEPPSWFQNVEGLINGGDVAFELLRKFLGEIKLNSEIEPCIHQLYNVYYYPPIMKPEKILCVGMNYKEHVKETGNPLPEEPYIFTKLVSNLIGHKWPVLIPKISKQVDHEGELAVVIGKTGKYISKEEAMNYVLGYTVFNDISFRDLRPSKRYVVNWLRSKNLDTAAPIGPWIVTKDEIDDPYNLEVKVLVNDELRQKGNTNDMIFSISELIEYISKGLTLKPGDIISTGTPAGTGLSTGKFLRAGDVVRVIIEKIGTLENPVISE